MDGWLGRLCRVADEELLAGGLVNAGQVTRRADAVRRPAPAHAAVLHQYLNRLAAQGFTGAPTPLRLSPDGYEELTFIPGDVAISPYPDWALTEGALASVGRLLRRMHDTASTIAVPEADWPPQFADIEGAGPILCHNDVCPENTVFRDGEAVAFIDFDFAAPGRPIWDLAYCAWYWVPMLPPRLAAVEGQPGLDAVARLRVLADAYGLDDDERRELLALIPVVLETSHWFVAARVAAGDPVFTRIDAERDPGRWEACQMWLDEYREEFLRALLA